MNNSPVKSELYVALEMVELTQFLPFTKFYVKTIVPRGTYVTKFYNLNMVAILTKYRLLGGKTFKMN